MSFKIFRPRHVFLNFWKKFIVPDQFIKIEFKGDTYSYYYLQREAVISKSLSKLKALAMQKARIYEINEVFVRK